MYSSCIWRIRTLVVWNLLPNITIVKGIAGKDFRTTIDQEVQKFTSKLLKKKSASVCVMDIYTGDIVALVSNPTFDANKFVHGINQKDWDALIQNKKNL